MSDEVETFCRIVQGLKLGTEERCTYTKIKIPGIMSDLYHDSMTLNGTHHTVVSIPTENIKHILKNLVETNHPSDDNFVMMQKKRQLYDTDPYFKSLCDQMNAYLYMFGDI